MEKREFSNGGFVLHKIAPRGNGNGRISAWYDANGNMTDCEYIDTLNRSRKCGEADKKHCRLLGNIWK